MGHSIQGMQWRHLQALPLPQQAIHDLLQICIQTTDLTRGRQLHALMAANEQHCRASIIWDRLIHLFAVHGSFVELNLVFCKINKPNSQVWFAIMSAYALGEQWELVLELYAKLQLDGLLPSKDISILCLKVCSSIGSLEKGKLVHNQIVNDGITIDSSLGSILIFMYANFASLGDARRVFDGLKDRSSVVAWGAIISAYLQHGQCLNALMLYEELQSVGVMPDKFLFPCILKACGSIGVLGHGRLLHEDIMRSGFDSDVVIGSAIVDMYCKCGSLEEARRVFDRLPSKNIVTWGAMIAGYGQHGYHLSSFDLFERMESKGFKPNQAIFLALLNTCGTTGGLQKGRLIHNEIIVYSLESNVAVANALIYMYAKSGSLDEAHKLLRNLKSRNVVSWNAMIAGLMQHGHVLLVLEFYKKMRCEGIAPNNFVFSCILKACGSIGALKQGMRIHNWIIKESLEIDVVLGSSLVDIYTQNGALYDAWKTLARLQKKNVVSWDVLIGGYVEQGDGISALHLFENMKSEGMYPNVATYLLVIKVCGDTDILQEGRLLHQEIMEVELDKDAVVASALIDMYAKWGNLNEACTIFDKLSNRNVFSWCAMLRAYTHCGYATQALDHFGRMEEEGIAPDKVTFLLAIKASTCIGAVKQGKLLHGYVVVTKLDSDLMIGNALIDMYSKCGKLDESWNVFSKLPSRDCVSWSAIILGYALIGDVARVLGLFDSMQQQLTKPDRPTLLCVLKACGSIGALERGKLIHDHARYCGLDVDVFVGNALVEMYITCGSLEEACKVFDCMLTRDDVSWGTMIAGYATHGMPDLAWKCVEEMRKGGMKPDNSIYTSIFSSCSRVGKVHDGCQYFRIMIEDHGVEPTNEHLNCMVYLFGHVGCLEEAVQLLRSIPGRPDLTGWMSLLTSSRVHGDIGLGRQSFDELSQIDLSFAAGYAFMADMYCDVHHTEGTHIVQGLKDCNRAWNKPGKSWVEVDGSIQEFIVGDRTHAQFDEILLKLNKLSVLLKERGYV